MRNEGMLNPFNCNTLALSYIKGVQVDDWVAQQIDEVYWKAYGNNTVQPNIAPIYADNDERLWSEFVDEFIDAFGDWASEERAYGDLKGLELKGDTAEGYISTFECLMKQACWEID